MELLIEFGIESNRPAPNLASSTDSNRQFAHFSFLICDWAIDRVLILALESISRARTWQRLSSSRSARLGRGGRQDAEVTVFTRMLRCCTVQQQEEEGRQWRSQRDTNGDDGGTDVDAASAASWRDRSEMPPAREISAVSRVQRVTALKISPRQLTRRTISCRVQQVIVCFTDLFKTARAWTRNVSREKFCSAELKRFNPFLKEIWLKRDLQYDSKKIWPTKKSILPWYCKLCQWYFLYRVQAVAQLTDQEMVDLTRMLGRNVIGRKCIGGGCEGGGFCSKMDEGGSSSQWQLINSIKSAAGGGREGILGWGRGTFLSWLKKWGLDIFQHSRLASPSPAPFVRMRSHNHIKPKGSWCWILFPFCHQGFQSFWVEVFENLCVLDF